MGLSPPGLATDILNRMNQLINAPVYHLKDGQHRSESGDHRHSGGGRVGAKTASRTEGQKEFTGEEIGNR